MNKIILGIPKWGGAEKLEQFTLLESKLKSPLRFGLSTNFVVKLKDQTNDGDPLGSSHMLNVFVSQSQLPEGDFIQVCCKHINEVQNILVLMIIFLTMYTHPKSQHTVQYLEDGGPIQVLLSNIQPSKDSAHCMVLGGQRT